VPRPARPKPRELTSNWPRVPSDDPVAEVARQFAVRLRDALAETSVREASRLTGVDHATLGAVLNGNTWPDLVTIARLELGLDVDLWPGRIARAKP
jgi:hypothetical protein